MSDLDYVIVDAFAAQPLGGNPAAIFRAADHLDPGLMQRLAGELNLSETVFCLECGHADARLRIFTPRREVPFAGHPVLAAAHVLGEALPGGRMRLSTCAGTVTVERETRAGSRPVYRMRQSIPTWAVYDDAPRLLSGLGMRERGLPIERYENGPSLVLVDVGSVPALSALRPDLSAIAQLDVVATCYAADGEGWRMRAFAPANGVDEDPATGSAAAALAVHLARHRAIAFGTEIEICQGVEVGRPYRLHARATGSADGLEAVEVMGTAITVASGRFVLGD